MAEQDKRDLLGVRAMSPRVRCAVDVVRAAGEIVSDEGIEILERVERGEIDTEEAVRQIILMHGGQTDEV